MTPELLVLRLVHILGGIFWVGSGLFTAFFFAPALRASGTNSGPLFAALGRRRLFLVLPVVALLTIASGFRLMWIMSAGFSAAYAESAVGRGYIWSGGAAVIAFLLSLLIARPANVRGGQLAAAAAKAPEHERARLQAEAASVQRRGGMASSISVALLILAAGGMAVARYL